MFEDMLRSCSRGEQLRKVGEKRVGATHDRSLTLFRRGWLFALLAMLLLPATANAADSLYWGNRERRHDPGRKPGRLGEPWVPDRSGEGGPCGVALDPAAGKVYWANFGGGEIQVANLDGSGPGHRP